MDHMCSGKQGRTLDAWMRQDGAAQPRAAVAASVVADQLASNDPSVFRFSVPADGDELRRAEAGG